MEDYFIKIRDRLAFYHKLPDPAYKTDSGYELQEEAIMQKLRQYWAGDRISNEEKLKDFDLDLTDFDPRNTSFNEMKKIGLLLFDLGIVDNSTRSNLDYAGVEFDARGKQISKDKKVDAYEWMHRNMDYLKSQLKEGFDYPRDTLIKFELVMKVMLALEERALQCRSVWVDVCV